MRILHAPYEIAGQAYTISRAQRKLGYESDVMVFNRSPFGFECDINLNLKQYRYFFYDFIRLKAFLKLVPKYDVFHFHFAESFLKFNLDLPLLKLLKKRVVMQYWGSDVLQTDIAKETTLFSPKDLEAIYPNSDNVAKRSHLNWIRRNVKGTIIGDPSYVIFAPGSVVIRQAVDLTRLPYVGSREHRGRIKIVHAPSNRQIKGTKFILKAIKRLEKEFKIDFSLVERKPNQQAIEIYKSADIIVDDLLQGPYGILGIESMALGKPVLCRVDPRVRHYYKNLPIINTTPNNVYSNLRELILKPKLREKLGYQGRLYVEKNHDSVKIARQYIKLYKKSF